MVSLELAQSKLIVGWIQGRQFQSILQSVYSNCILQCILQSEYGEKSGDKGLKEL